MSTAPVEAGYTTTEFWASVATSVAILIHPWLQVPMDVQMALVTLLWSIYTIARTWRKNG